MKTTITPYTLIRNLFGSCRKVHSGWYYHRFSLPRFIRGEYPWLSAIADTPAAAKAAAMATPRARVRR